MEKLFAMMAGLGLIVPRRAVIVTAMIKEFVKMESAFASAATQAINASSSSALNYAAITAFAKQTENATASKASKVKNATS